ncbi:hypothetical protein L5515_018998 [Caenorhabditis briggsae]|uniref:Uncharacterized protein n=1 Tax=Caenorhabditis briggsae TaxID=6238 RepID=A0AAE9FJF7_CAEBR|nr:hypothetical protein L5515_018998 [Caenorhabditis briggsae]
MVYAHLELKRTYDRDVICQDIPMIQENSERLFRNFPTKILHFSSRYTLHADIGGFHFNLVNGDLGSIFFYNNAEAGMLSTGARWNIQPGWTWMKNVIFSEVSGMLVGLIET